MNITKGIAAPPTSDPRNITLKRFLNISFEIDEKKK